MVPRKVPARPFFNIMNASQQTINKRIAELRKEAKEAQKLQDYETMFLLLGKADELESTLDPA